MDLLTNPFKKLFRQFFGIPPALLGVGILFCLIASLIFARYGIDTQNPPSIYLRAISSIEFKLITILYSILFIVYLLSKWLNRGLIDLNASQIKERVDQISEPLSKLIDDLVANVVAIKGTQRMDDTDRVEIPESARQRLIDNVKKEAIENITNDLRAEINKIEAEMSSGDRNFESYIRDAIFRLKQETRLLTKRASTNLAVGAVLSACAVAILWYFVIYQRSETIDPSHLVLHLVPRLSLAIFVELFAFFFLKIYRASIAEIKYYQNELTNLELKAAATLISLDAGTSVDRSELIKVLSNAERNFKLAKGESTVDIERNKLDSDQLMRILEAASRVVQPKKDSSK